MGAVAHITAAPDVAGLSAGTRYHSLSSCAQLLATTTESLVQVKWRTPGTFSDFSAKLRLNASGTTSTARVRKNATNGNQVVSITAGSTGHFQDLVNTDSVVAADLMSHSLTHGGGAGDISPCSFGVVFEATSGNFVARWTCRSGAVITATGFLNLAGGSSDILPEATVETSIPVTGTLANGGVYLSANTRNGTGTYRLRVTQANAAIVMTSPAATTGWFEDLTNTQAVTAGQRGAWSIDPGGSTGLITLNLLTMDYTTTGRAPFATSDFSANAFGATVYAPIAGYFWDATEADVEAKALTAHMLSDLTCLVTSNTINGAQTLRTRINNANGNQVVAITASSTGWFSDVTNTDSVVASDVLSYQNIAAGSSGAAVFRTIGMGGGVETVVPTVETLSATNVRSRSAILRGRIDPNGTAMDGRFRWWICAESPPSYTYTDAQTIGSGANPVTYTETITGLLPSTTYCFQALGDDGGSPELEGAIKSFTTSGEALFIDGTVSHPLTWMELYVEEEI